MPSFLDAKKIVHDDLLSIMPESSMHDMWIRQKLAALDRINSETDLAPTNASTKPFDPVAAVSDMILAAMK